MYDFAPPFASAGDRYANYLSDNNAIL